MSSTGKHLQAISRLDRRKCSRSDMPIQARTEFASALNQIASEKGVDVSIVVEAIEQAALAAYRKDLSLRGEEIPEDFDDLTAKIDSASGEIKIMRGDRNVTPPGFARIAAQTAKQVIMQRLHEAEKGAIMEEYDKKVGTLITGTIQRQEGNTFFVDLGRAEGVLPPSEQTRDEYYHMGQRLKFFIKEIRETGRGPEVVVSRTDPGLVKGLFAMEVPEIQSGSVVIKEIAREAGGRTKISAISTQDGVDPVGSLVGQKGVRVQTVINELGEEKIDIVPFSEDPTRYIASALSPAKEVQVSLSETDKIAKVRIPSSQLSLAIGKGGQNVRLAAKLTGYKIDIEGIEEPSLKDVGTHEDEVQADAVSPATNPQDQTTEETKAKVEEKVEEAIDTATVEESADGATQPEPADDEQSSKAAADAEQDIQADKVMEEGSGGGDLIATEQVDETGEPEEKQ
jgi:N utilization substance protein A